MHFDVIVLGGGPAGLGAALSLVRAGARVALIDGGERMGGMSVTVTHGDVAFDLGGHVLFVHDTARHGWLRELLGPDLLWVDRPVASIDDGRIQPGRYLDRRADGLGPPPRDTVGGPAAADLLNTWFGPQVVDRHMRRYLEKIDGMPLEQITAARARKLLVEQYAPDGFWFPAGGVGQLMDAMARAIVAGRGQLFPRSLVEAIETRAGAVESVAVMGLDGRPLTLTAPAVIAAIPPLAAARLVAPRPAPPAIPALAARATIVVALRLPVERVTDEAWIQVDRADVPFARLAEMPNWSSRMAPPGTTTLVCEVYCHPTADDRWWSLSDESIARACAAALIEPLELVDSATAITTLDVVRLPRAWSLVDVDHLDAVTAVGSWLATIDGLAVAQGGDVITAIAAGEHAAATVAAHGA